MRNHSINFCEPQIHYKLNKYIIPGLTKFQHLHIVFVDTCKFYAWMCIFTIKFKNNFIWQQATITYMILLWYHNDATIMLKQTIHIIASYIHSNLVKCSWLAICIYMCTCGRQMMVTEIRKTTKLYARFFCKMFLYLLTIPFISIMSSTFKFVLGRLKQPMK